MQSNYEYLREQLELEAIDCDDEGKLPKTAEGFEDLDDDYLAEFCGYEHFLDFVYKYSQAKAINPVDWFKE